MTSDNKILKAFRWLKSKTIFAFPKCPHMKLYRLPHDVYLCPECFRTWNARSMWFDSIGLDDKEIDKLFKLRKELSTKC